MPYYLSYPSPTVESRDERPQQQQRKRRVFGATQRRVFFRDVIAQPTPYSEREPYYNNFLSLSFPCVQHIYAITRGSAYGETSGLSVCPSVLFSLLNKITRRKADEGELGASGVRRPAPLFGKSRIFVPQCSSAIFSKALNFNSPFFSFRFLFSSSSF